MEETSESEESKPAEVKKARIDVMSNVSVTGDRLGLSARKRACFAASCVSAVNVPVQQTNISVTTAWRKARAMRGECSSTVKENFECPDHVLIHWDGKIMKVKGGKTSERCCVYISGVSEEGDKTKKLLSIPEIPDGTGSSQEFAVTNLVVDWKVKSNIIGLVFDTTASNTQSGKWRGACILIEAFLGSSILWIACRHHIAELLIKHAVEATVGDTKDIQG